MILALVLVSLIALVFLFVIKQRQLFKLTEHIPGPTPLPFIGNALELGTSTADLLKNLLRLTKTYGSVVCVCMGSQVSVLLTNPKYMAQVLTTTGDYYKGDMYKILQPLSGDGIVTSSGEKWARHRRILNAAFTTKQLPKYVAVFNNAAEQLVDQLKKQLIYLEYVEVTEPVFAFTLYSVCKAVMGVDITKNVEYHRNVDKVLKLFFNRFMSPLKMIDFFYRFTSEYRETQICGSFINDFVEGVITKRKQQLAMESKETQYTSMLDEMLRLSGEDVLTHKEIVDEVKTFVIAGSDTVGVTLSFAIYELAKHPSIQAKLLEEIEFVLGTDLECDVNYEDLHQLKYTECVIKEILRIYAPAIMVTRTLPSKMYFDDLYVPANTVAFIFIYGLHHSEQFHPNPEKFDPDRFLPENFANQPKNSYIPFASGARACIGNKFAMLEAKLTLAKIIWNFEIFKKPGHEPELVATGSLKSVNGLPVKLKLRQPTRT